MLVVVILEPEVDRFESLFPFYSGIFSSLGYKCQIIHAQNESALLKILKTQFVHVAVCDLSMGNTENFLGLHTVRQVKVQYPDVVCIGNTRGDLLYQQSVYPTFDIFVDKGRLLQGDGKYATQVAEQVALRLRVNVDVEVDGESDLSGAKRVKGVRDRDLLSVIAQVTYTIGGHDVGLSIDRVKLTPLTGGRSGSDVFRIEAFARGHALACVPGVLKISDRENATIEHSNYHKYVKWLLPYAWRVDVLGVGFTKDLGGICYSFVLSGNKHFDSLTYYLALGRDDIIDRLTETVLSPDMKRWYGLIGNGENILQRYSARYIPTPAATIAALRQCEYVIQRDLGGVVGGQGIKIGRRAYGKPHEVLLRRHRGDYMSCICHGDLNSNNIVITSDGDFIFIDFQHTGRGHVFEDFIMLEVSVRLYYPDEYPLLFEERFASEHELNEWSTQSRLPILDQCRKIRDVARKNFPDENWERYLYGLGVMLFSIMRYETVPRERKAKLIPCMLAIVSRFD